MSASTRRGLDMTPPWESGIEGFEMEVECSARIKRQSPQPGSSLEKLLFGIGIE